MMLTVADEKLLVSCCLLTLSSVHVNLSENVLLFQKTNEKHYVFR